MSLKIIYSQLTAAGITPTGAIALLGNWKEESGIEACRLQGDFQNDRWASKNYANRVDSGIMLEEAYYRDGKGWGLAQLTFWTRKKGLLDLCHQRGVSIADETTQVDYTIYELSQPEYKKLGDFLKSCDETQLYTAVSRVCKEYERPQYNNIETRYRSALEIREELQRAADVVETYWPPRMIDKGMRGSDVSVLQAILLARGYSVASVSGNFDASTDKALRKFQKDNALAVDGVCGPKSWGELLETG